MPGPRVADLVVAKIEPCEGGVGLEHVCDLCRHVVVHPTPGKVKVGGGGVLTLI